MATTNLYSSSIIRQRINKDVAVYISEHSEPNFDELLLIAATPALRSDFKNIDLKSLYSVMLKMRAFLKGRQKFLNFTKEAVKEGLAKEWLPMLEEDDKVKLLENIAVIERIEDDGTIVTKEKVYRSFVDANIPDTIRYGESAYYSIAQPKPREPKKKLTVVGPDANLADKLDSFIKWYKEWWKYMVNHEHFKWDATEQFKNEFDINADNLATNLKDALSKEEMLLSGHMNFSKQMLLLNAEYSQEDVKSVLEMLFDENIDLAKRADDFITQFNAIHEANKAAGKIKANQAPHQNPHSVSVYLAFANPSYHYIYKESVWLDFKAVTDLDYPSLYNFSHKLVGYDQICNHIREVLLADKELVALHDASYPDDKSDYHLLTQDFIYAIAVHLVDFDKKPAYFNDEDAKLYNM